MAKPQHLFSHKEAICNKKIYQFVKTLMNVERSFRGCPELIRPYVCNKIH